MGNLITLVCPTCGGKLKIYPGVASLTCQHCGNQHLVRWDGDAVTLEAYARCPICGRNDQAGKVTAVIASQSHEISGVEKKSEIVLNAQGKQEVAVRDVPFTRRQVSVLGQRLAPPPQPVPAPLPLPESAKKNAYGLGWFILAFMIGLSSFFLMLRTLSDIPVQYRAGHMQEIYIGLGVGVLIFLLAVLIGGLAVLAVILRHRKVHQQQRQYEASVRQITVQNECLHSTWKRSLERWDRLYYCSRDDCVFIPGEGTSAPLSGMQAYLQATPGRAKVD